MSEIGNILRNTRVKSGYSLEEVNKNTKIRLHILQAIEDGNYSALPAVYMKSFISDYMRFLGLSENVDEVINELFPKDKNEILAKQSYNLVSEQQSKKTNYDEIFSKKRKKKDFFNKTSVPMYFLYSAILLVILVILYFAFFRSKATPQVENIPANSESTQIIADESLIENKVAPSDSMALKILAKDTVWIRISNDAGSLKQTVLYPGNELQMKAWEYFTISSDKASAMDIYREGNILPKLSNQGSAVRNVKITRTDIISPTSVYSDSTIKKRRAINKKAKEENVKKPYILEPSPITR